MKFTHFSKYPNLQYGFSTRADGSMNRHLCKENRARYFASIGIDPARAVAADLVHGADVVLAGDNEGGILVPETDALITATKNLFLTVTNADCLALFLYDPLHNAIGIVHAGWRGLLGGVVNNAIKKMMKEFGTLPEVILAGIGPAIRVCHFEIGRNDVPQYETYKSRVVERDGKVFVDLAGIMKDQLAELGLASEHIEDCGACTYCDKDDYFSYRRDKPKDIEAMVGYVGMR